MGFGRGPVWYPGITRGPLLITTRWVGERFGLVGERWAWITHTLPMMTPPRVGLGLGARFGCMTLRRVAGATCLMGLWGCRLWFLFLTFGRFDQALARPFVGALVGNCWDWAPGGEDLGLNRSLGCAPPAWFLVGPPWPFMAALAPQTPAGAKFGAGDGNDLSSWSSLTIFRSTSMCASSSELSGVSTPLSSLAPGSPAPDERFLHWYLRQ